jgi:hypothetical protein
MLQTRMLVESLYLLTYLFMVFLIMSVSQNIASNSRMTGEKAIKLCNEAIIYILR